MYKLYISILKELNLLRRDLGGLLILFIMPLVLIITITLIQDSTFKTVVESKIPILIINNDKAEISNTIIDQLNKSESFEILEKLDNKILTEENAQELVFKGKYQLAIVIPQNLTKDLNEKVNANVEGILSQFGAIEVDTLSSKQELKIDKKQIKLYFDPATQITFKSNVKNAIDKMVSQIETKSIYEAFQSELGEDSENGFQQENFIEFTEINPKVGEKEILPNSVQHNVPAWALFAIFFIVVPLSINIVKEKSQGTHIRLLTNPVSYFTVIFGKTITYLLICYIQFILMILVGMFLFPYLNLPTFEINNQFFLLSLVAIFSGLAAIGFGVLIGTIANTQEQSAPFGATSVVILAAIGGVWVPVFAMPKIMQYVSHISPMNWGLNAFYDIILRQGNLIDIMPELILLLLFFCLTIFIALAYDKKKRAV